MEDRKRLKLIWHNFQPVLSAKLRHFLYQKKYCDVSLITGDKFIRVHKVILASYSPFFERIFDSFNDSACSSSQIVLDQICFDDLVCIIEFFYTGKVEILKKNFERFMGVIKTLQLKGISQTLQGDVASSDHSQPPQQSTHSDGEESLLTEVFIPDPNTSIDKSIAPKRSEDVKRKINQRRRRHKTFCKSCKNGNFQKTYQKRELIKS